MKQTRRLIALVITIAMVLMSISSILAVTEIKANDPTDFVPGTVEGDASIDPDSDVLILVKVDGTSALQQTKSVSNAAKVAEKMLAKLPAQIERVETKLGEKIEVKDQFALLFNGFSFEGKYWMLEELNELDGITAFIPATFEVAADDDYENVVTPNMSNSTVTIGAQQAWDLGYTGEGTFIAIIDTGIRHTHEAFSVMPTNTKVDVDYLENIISQYGDLLHFGHDASQLYYSAKQAFNWDYYDNDYDPNHTASDHGTHVAGIAAGNNGTDFKGVAPDAQLAVMQVFEESGSAYFSTVLKALEDCAYLGVDTINMSLGSAAGFTTPYVSVLGLSEAFDALEAAGISVNAAAGNDMNNTLWTTFGDWFYSNYKTLSTNPDYGLVGSPSTFPGSFSVASVVNGSANTGYLKVDGVSYYYGSTTSCDNLGTIPGTYRIVYAGYGSTDEFAAIDAEGAIALVGRGNGITFTDKCTNAAAAGAVGVLMFNNTSGSFNPSVTSTIPLGLLTQSEGLAIVDQLNGGVTQCTIVPGVSYGSINMASSSSWGTTADLKIKPEISAPGDGVYSAIGTDTDTSYASWSGTSMATPHISAALSIIKQRLREIFPDATAATINELAYAFAMSTANQANGFVRQQGAGLIDIVKAISSDVYLSVPNSSRPKLEVGESEDGTFTFTFVLNNIGDVDHTYSISVKALTEQISTEVYDGHWTHEEEPTVVDLISGTIYDVSGMVTNNAPATVTVPAGGTATVTMTIAANEELMSYFDEYFPVGAFLEGWVKLTENTDDGIDLSIPFLGYVGDWDEPSMLDRGYYWQAATGEVNLMSFVNTLYNIAGYGNEQGLGINRYADMTGETYLPDRNAISPNGDGIYDAFTYVEFVLLRNASLITLNVEDLNGNVIENLYTTTYSNKDSYSGGFVGAGESWHDIVVNYDGSALAENETVNIVLETWLDHEGYLPENNESGRWVIPVTKDTQAPDVTITDDGISIVDENYVAYYAIYSDAELTDCIYETGVFGEERGLSFDYATTEDHFYVAVADYAGNEEVYEINNGAVICNNTSFSDNGRTIYGFATENFDADRCEIGWVSFKPGTSVAVEQLTNPEIKPIDNSFFGGEYQYQDAAVDNNGTVYAVVGEVGNYALGSIVAIDHETFDETLVYDANSCPDYTMSARNIAFNPETNECIAVMYFNNHPTIGSGKKLVSIDLETLDVTLISDLSSVYDPWGMDVMDKDRIVLYDGNRSLVIMDYEGNTLETVVMPCFDPQYSSSHIGGKGYTGDLLYDEQHNCVYVSSHWSWLGYDRPNTGGMFEYDFDTNSFTIHRIGDGRGRIVMGMFFIDEAGSAETIPLESFELSEDELNMYLYGSATVDFLRNPSDANNYTVEWSSSDESIVTVSGNRRRAEIVSEGNVGTATITCVVYVDDVIFGVDEVTVTVGSDPELNAAANVPGGSLVFGTTNPYPFTPVQDEGRYYLTSTNQGQSNSASELIAKAWVGAGETIEFDYFVSSEVDYDFFRFYANGECVFECANLMDDWDHYVYTIPYDGEFTFMWCFEKDPAAEDGLDCAYIDNIAFSGDIGIISGDVNGDGEVSMADATLAARYALGLYQLTPTQFEVADMNGDGVVTMADALLIMRIAAFAED